MIQELGLASMELTLRKRKWKKNRKNISQKISVQNEPPHFEHLFSFKKTFEPVFVLFIFF
ncbi:hypothetical protein DXC25_10220 [Enterococcus faecalis]|nr:hypothetical protein DXC25_10220 [Enterococcus faecalis]